MGLEPNNSKDWLLECECRFFYNEIKINGRNWWEEKKKSIKKKRGQNGLDALVERLENYRKNIK